MTIVLYTHIYTNIYIVLYIQVNIPWDCNTRSLWFEGFVVLKMCHYTYVYIHVYTKYDFLQIAHKFIMSKWMPEAPRNLTHKFIIYTRNFVLNTNGMAGWHILPKQVWIVQSVTYHKQSKFSRIFGKTLNNF